MDIRDILKSFDNLSEATTTTDKGTVHKAGPGGYGNRHGSEDVTDQYGKPIARASLSKMNTAPPVKRGKGRPPKNADSSGEVKSYDSSALSKAMGMGKAPKPTGKPSVKHSLKEYFDQMDEEKLGELSTGLVNKVHNARQQNRDTTSAADMSDFDTRIQAKADSMGKSKWDSSVRVGPGQHAPAAAAAQQKFDRNKQMTAKRANSDVANDQAAQAAWGQKVGQTQGSGMMREAGLAVQPMPATPQQKQQQQMATKPSFMIKNPADPSMPAITTQDPAVVDAAKKGTMTMQKPGAAPTAPGATPAAGAGSQVKPMEERGDELSTRPSMFRSKADMDNRMTNAGEPTSGEKRIQRYLKHTMKNTQKQGGLSGPKGVLPEQGMAEGGDVGKHNNATTGFDALVRKLTPKYGKESAMKIAGAQLKKIKEAEAPQHFAQSSPLSTANRGVLESKKTVKKDDKAEKDGKKVTKDLEYDMGHKGKDDAKAEKAGKKVTKDIEYDDKKKKIKEAAKPDFLDLDKDGNKKEPMKAAAKDKKKVKEGMDSKLQAARLRGKSHALAKEAYNCHYDDMEESRCYHEGFKEGLDECYGQMPILGRTAVGEMGQGPEVDTMASYGADELGEMDKTSYMKQQAIKTPGGTFKAFGQTMHDSNVLDEFAFEAFDSQLKALLESEEKVSEGMTVSISKGQQGAPDSVSVSAQDGEADQLLSIIKSAGMGLFGGDEQNGYGAPQGSTQAPGGIEVVDDHDGMMALMKKLSGGGEVSGGDYESEEGHGEEEHMHGEEGHSHEGEEDSCNECGMAYESCGCDHGDEEVVVEQESEDQMMYNVAEDNPPDNGSANSTNDEQGNATANQALATADAEENADDKEVTVSEEDDEEEEKVEEGIYESYANSADDTFEADIEFMTNVITGGLNKRKATGQTTIPVIAGQKDRMGADGLGSPMKESTDLLKDFRKLSGL